MMVRHLSVRSLTLLIFLLLGAIVVAQVIYSTKLYREAATHSKADTIAQMIGVAANKTLEDLQRHSARLGSALEQHSELRDAFRHWLMYKDPLEIVRTLDEPFTLGHAEAANLSLEKLRVYDLRGMKIAESAHGAANLPPSMDAELSMLLLSRDGAERLQATGGLWRNADRTFYSTIVPIGGLRLRGYLEVVTDPTSNLSEIGNILRMPVMVQPADALEFPVERNDSKRKRVSHLLTTMGRSPAFYLFGFIPLEDFDHDIRTNSLYLSGVHLAGIGSALFLGYLLLLRFLVTPVKKMSKDIAYASQQSMEVSVNPRGVKEFAELAESFNRLMGEVQAQKETLRQLSMVDGLTALANRRAFDFALKREWQRAIRDHEPLSLLMIDIDFFKRYNDTYGHQQGDVCLARVAAVIGGAATRSSDLAARYGGEEFAVILPGTGIHGARIVGEKLAQAVRDLQLPHASSEAADHITLSIGVSGCNPRRPVEESCIVQCADHALYKAKLAGRNRVACAGVQPPREAVIVPFPQRHDH